MGFGAFGRVLEADAVGLNDNEPVTKVAVKMVRSQLSSATSNVAIESFISELKILSYLGSHLNVVNLLGACIKRISSGELCVIVEYCRFGNLCTFLRQQPRQQRTHLVNLIDSITGSLMKSDYCAITSPMQLSHNNEVEIDSFK